MKPIALLAALLTGIPVLGAPAPVSEPPPWKAGVAKADITPDAPMWLSGYGGRTKASEGKLTDLWAKALVIEDPAGKRMVLVTLDLVGINRGLSKVVCARLTEKYGLDRAAILINCSHTHSGPVVGENLAPMYALDASNRKMVQIYAKHLYNNIVTVVGDAIGKLAPARLSFGHGHATFAVNRRNNKEADVPALRAAGKLKGPVDHDVPVLVVRDAQDNVTAIAALYACHATVLNGYDWCGDYPGYFQIQLEKAYPGVVAMFIAGCGADQNPLPRRKVELAEGYGRELAESVAAVVRAPTTPLTGGVAAEYGEIDLPFGDLPDKDALTKDAESKDTATASRAKSLLEELARQGKLRPTYPYPVQAWRLGSELTLVALGGEVVVDYSLRLKRELAGRNVWVAGYCNDVMAYIPSLRVLNEGGYEGGKAMVYYGLPTAWSPRVEEMIVERVKEAVVKVSAK